MRHEARWDRTNDEIREDLARLRARGEVVVALSSYRDRGVTRHAVVSCAAASDSPAHAEQRLEVGLDAAHAPLAVARHARDGFHPVLVGMTGPASKPEIALVLERREPGETSIFVPPTPFRDQDGAFFAARIAGPTPRERGYLRSVAAAGEPLDARGAGLVVAGIWSPEPPVHVAWAVHLDALDPDLALTPDPAPTPASGQVWRDRWEVRTLETVARPVMAIPIVSSAGARWVLSLWHDRILEPWPIPDPLALARRFECDEVAGSDALARAIDARRAEDRRVLALGAGAGPRFIALYGACGTDVPLTRRFTVVAPGDDPPTHIGTVLSLARPDAAPNPMRPDVTQRPEQTPPVTPPHPLDAWVLTHMRETGARHGQLAVVRGRKLAFARAYTYAEPGYPIARLDHALRLGSVSKAITTIALLRTLAQRHPDLASGLDASVTDLLGFAPDEGPPALHAVTLRHLLTHRAGFRTFPDVRPDDPQNPLSEHHVTTLLHGAPGRANPGELGLALRRVHDDGLFARAPGSAPPDYSNEGFILLGEILSQLVHGHGQPRDYESALLRSLLVPAGVDPGQHGCLFGAGRRRARARHESPAHPSSPTWATKPFPDDDIDDNPLTLSSYAANGPFLGGAAGIAVPLLWVARVLANLGPFPDGTGLWQSVAADIAAAPALPGSPHGHGFHIGEPSYWTFRPSGGGTPRTVRVHRLHHNGRLDGGAALLIHLFPHDPREAQDATLSVIAAFNQLGALYEAPHGRQILAILRQLEGSPGWDEDRS